MFMQRRVERRRIQIEGMKVFQEVLHQHEICGLTAMSRFGKRMKMETVIIEPIGGGGSGRRHYADVNPKMSRFGNLRVSRCGERSVFAFRILQS